MPDKFKVDKSNDAVEVYNSSIKKSPFKLPQAVENRANGLFDSDYSVLGQPYYATDFLGREFFLPVTLNGHLIPFAVLSINEKKTIVETAMPERGGSVKELISIDDYIINLKGILIEEDNIYPEQQIIDIHNIFLLNESIPIRSVLTDIFLNGAYNHSVVIKEIKWPANPGVQNAKPFEIDMVADMIFTLEIK
jgi:hypothetical protein